MKQSPDTKSFIIDELKRAIETLDSGHDPHFIVHEVRKSFKKIRSYLRLIRDQIDFKSENQFFRDLGLEISEIRDLTTCMEALESLKEYQAQSLSNNTCDEIQNYLDHTRNQLSELVLVRESILDLIRERLEAKLEEIKRWDPEEDVEGIGRNFNKTIQQVMKASSIAKASADTEDYHEWRKKVKHLRYQSELILMHQNITDSEVHEVLHKLSDYLGWDHDLAILESVISQNSKLFKDPIQKQKFMELLNKRREELRDAARNVDESEMPVITRELEIN